MRLLSYTVRGFTCCRFSKGGSSGLGFNGLTALPMSCPNAFLFFILASLLGFWPVVMAGRIEERPTALAANASERMVFCHFMASASASACAFESNMPCSTAYANASRKIGITSKRNSAADYDDDMKRAKAMGIDAFALNIGIDPYTDRQLGFAYESAAGNGMSVFLSFDFNWWSTAQADAIGAKIRQYAGLPAQLVVDGKVFVSSFAGDGIDVSRLRSATGRDIFFAPNFRPGVGDFDQLDGALNWMAWDNNGENKAPTPGHNVTVADGDAAYIQALAGRPYLARE